MVEMRKWSAAYCVTNATDKAKFLGYDVTVSKRSSHFTRRKQGKFRNAGGVVKLYVPKEKWMRRLLDNENMIIQRDDTGKEKWKPVARSSFVNRAPVEIIGGFNSEIRGLYNYYSLASNVSVLNKYYYIMQYSLYHTFAAKYRCPRNRIIERFKKNGVFGMEYITPSGVEKHIEFYHEGFKKKPPKFYAEVDIIPKPVTKCELCGESTNIVKVQQVAALKDLDPTKEWDSRMIKMRRKSLVVCDKCFRNIQTDM